MQLKHLALYSHWIFPISSDQPSFHCNTHCYLNLWSTQFFPYLSPTSHIAEKTAECIGGTNAESPPSVGECQEKHRLELLQLINDNLYIWVLLFKTSFRTCHPTLNSFSIYFPQIIQGIQWLKMRGLLRFPLDTSRISYWDNGLPVAYGMLTQTTESSRTL